jgi:peptidoglycan/LPS O-acetylase OafA/YrhL
VCLVAAVIYVARGGFAFQMSPARLVQHLLLFGDAKTIWTISTECQFYGLFLLLWAAHGRFGRYRDAWLAALCLTIIAGLWLLGFSGGHIEITGYLQIFLVGMLAALAYRNVPL